MTDSSKLRLQMALAVVGPTGSGKTALSLALAEHFGGEIVNCDSLQLYRYLNIGTAKVSQQDRRRVPHHLFDILDPDQVFTAGDYSRGARPILQDIASRDRVPVITGGTGFYYRALIHGLFAGPGKDEGLRDRLASRSGKLHRMLQRFDPRAAERIHPNDTQKLIRALEVCLLARRPMSEVQQEEGRDSLKGFRVIGIGLNPPRKALVERLNQRTRNMFETGLLAEVDEVLKRGFPVRSKAFEAIGYREAMQLRAGELTYAEAVEQAQISTRQYAKRQRTWFSKEPGILWIDGFGDHVETIGEAISLVDKHTKHL